MHKPREKESVKRVFEHEREVRYYASLIKKGLLPIEKYAVDKYFARKGKVLDVGCGAGREAFALAKQGFSVVGIDLSSNLVKFAKQYALKHRLVAVTFLCSDVEHLRYPKNTFDYVILPTQVIEHVKGRDNRINVLRQCKELLKENGILFFTTHERKSGLRWWFYWTKESVLLSLKHFVGIDTERELGDTWIDSVNPTNKAIEKAFIHFYTKREAIKDIRRASLTLVEVVSNEKLRAAWEPAHLKYAFICKQAKPS